MNQNECCSRSEVLPFIQLFLVVVGLGTCLASSIAGAGLSAARITTDNYSTHHVGGPDADVGIGDWFLGNGTICAGISDVSHESPMSPRGGVLLDLGHCGAADDQWAVLQPMLNLSQSSVIPLDEITAGKTDAEAWIRTRGIVGGVSLEITYSLSLFEKNALRVVTRVERIEMGERFFALGATILHPSSQTRPFLLQRGPSTLPGGFKFLPSDRHSMISMFRALIATDVKILVGSEDAAPISYGIEQLGTNLVPATKDSEALRVFSATGKHFTMVNTLAAPFRFGTSADAPTLFDLARAAVVDLAEHDAIESEIRIWVGDRADVAAITDSIWAGEVEVSGTINDPNARLHIDSAKGKAMTQVRPDVQGRFHLKLPPGAYRVRVLAPGDRRAEAEFVIPLEAITYSLSPIELPLPARVAIKPLGFKGRLHFFERESGRPVVFGDDYFEIRLGTERAPNGQEAPFVHFAASAAGDAQEWTVPPGHYRVVGVRGPEYEIAEWTIEAVAGKTSPLELRPLAQTAPTKGWIAADLHVHTGESFDSGLRRSRQISAFAASGAEVLVATEHDRIVANRPDLTRLGLDADLVWIDGLEMTSAYTGGDSPHSTGHWNLFPVEARARAYRGGAPNLEGRRIRDAIADLRSDGMRRFLQLNHPRAGREKAEGDLFFNHLGVAGEPFRPILPLTAAPNRALIEPDPTTQTRDLDFDGIELLNSPDLLRYRRVRADWFSLLLQGEYKVATANSDSHRLGVLVGNPRTYVATTLETLGDFSEIDFFDALHAGRAFGSTGPQLDVTFEGVAMGETFSGGSGILTVRVDAAAWVPVEALRIYVNGERVHETAIAAGETQSLPLAFGQDSFITVEIEGPAEGRYAELYPDFTPFAFSNPVFIDVDGNGRYDAPGLPTVLPPTLTFPDFELRQ